jgi:hypothetical protein
MPLWVFRLGSACERLEGTNTNGGEDAVNACRNPGGGNCLRKKVGVKVVGAALLLFRDEKVDTGVLVVVGDVESVLLKLNGVGEGIGVDGLDSSAGAAACIAIL